MWQQTSITSLLGIRYPILQGPMGGGLSSAGLVAAVSNAGGLGGYGAYTLTPEQILEADREIRTKTDQPYNINLWVSDVDPHLKDYTPEQFEAARLRFKPYFDELRIPLPEPAIDIPSKFEKQVEAIFRIKPAVFSFVFGIPAKEILQECRRLGIITAGGATTLDEALALEEAGVDAIVATGFEAGGHRPSFLRPAMASLTGTFTLIQQVSHKLRTPIIAAGGIADGKGVAAALTLGADAVQIGTAFLACDESGATPLHRQTLFSEASRHSVLTKAFTGRIGRGIANRITQDLAAGSEEIAPFPLQSLFLAPLRAAAIQQGRTDLVLFWGGQIAPVLKHTKAAGLMQSLIDETGSILRDH